MTNNDDTPVPPGAEPEENINEDEDTKPTLESRVIIALVVIFIVVTAVLVTGAIFERQKLPDDGSSGKTNPEIVIKKQ
jgi:hypothetical protein